MKISVIIPAHNEEASLPATLKAILSQDYPDFEVIVVDNDSQDRTAEIARGFSGVKLVREDRRGTMWACERGRQEANGEIIARLDADCLPERDWLSRGAAHFSDPRVSAVGGPYDYYDASFVFRLSYRFLFITIFSFSNWILQTFKKGACFMGGNSFMRASSLEAVGGFNTGLTFYGDDTDTAKRIASQGRVVFDTKLAIKSSSRRFKKSGVLSLQSRYLYHFFKQIFS